MTLLNEVIDNKKNKTFSLNVMISQDKKRIVYMAVRSGNKNQGRTIREIAEICDMSVYAVRNWLIKLEDDGFIYKIQKPRNSTWLAL